jgi:hypothetical protein
VTGPVNAGGLCPAQSTLFDAQVCDVPAFCGKNGSPFVNPLAPCACPEGEFLRFDVSVASALVLFMTLLAHVSTVD